MENRFNTMGCIVLVAGLPGSGKTTIARKLAEQFPKSFHLQVDSIRAMVVNGAINPNDVAELTPELIEQFTLEREGASKLAILYASSGYAVIVDDVALPLNFLEQYDDKFRRVLLHRVLLLPSLPETERRLRERGDLYDETFITNLPRLHNYLSRMPQSDWVVVDSSQLRVDETFQAVMDKTFGTNGLSLQEIDTKTVNGR